MSNAHLQAISAIGRLSDTCEWYVPCTRALETFLRRFADADAQLHGQGYTVAAMNVFSSSYPDKASLSGTSMASSYAAQIKMGLDFLTHANYSAWVDSSKIGMLGWGWGANGVLAAAMHPAVSFHAGVCCRNSIHKPT